MTREQMRQFMEQIFKDQILSTYTAGQREYARDQEDAFANFQRIAADMGLDQKVVLWTYLMKHRDGVAAYINGHQSQREPVTGRLKDMIVYLFLLWGMIEEEEREDSEQLNLPL